MMKERRFSKEHRLATQEKLSVLEKIKDFLRKKPEILFAYVHGSFSEGNRFKDIDVAIFVKDLKDEMEVEFDMSEVLSQLTGLPVEVRIVNHAPVSFQMAVLRNGILLMSNDENQRTDFIEDVSRRYREYSHFRNISLES